MPVFATTPRAILEHGIAAGAFPGAVAHLRRADDVVCDVAVGKLGVEAPFEMPTNRQTRYDLASLTKIYTLTAALMVLREAKIALETPLRRFFPAFEAPISLENLMAHRSGLVFPIQKLEVAANDWIPRIAAAPANAPGAAVLYSCTNYFLLARVSESVAGASLDELIQTRILTPLQCENTSFTPRNLENVAPTERHETGFHHGEVHDEAARRWRAQTQTCAGNAGLWASACDVARFAALWTKPDQKLLHHADIERAFSSRWPENEGFRGLGWQLDAPFYMDEAPRGTAGHLGFTGPSLVVHRASRSIAVILSNRVHPTRFGPNRLPFHREISRWLFDEPKRNGKPATNP
ncbi:MAG TPA: serine hydrolase domain-containing protein [Abditibacterium sp.]|jgi:CubicO group peptidase (beta-lactamase class C family)